MLTIIFTILNNYRSFIFNILETVKDVSQLDFLFILESISLFWLLYLEISSVINIAQAAFNVVENFHFSCLAWLSFITSSCSQNKKVGILFLWAYFMT